MPWVLLLDLAAIVTNFFLVGFLNREMGAIVMRAWFDEEPQAARLLGFALLATFIAQMIGAVLKRAPMRARMHAQRADADRAVVMKKKWARLRQKPATVRHRTLFYILLFLHFVLSSLIVFSLPVLLGVSDRGWAYGLSIPFMFIPTILVAAALLPPKPDQLPPNGWRVHPITETLANLGLFSYALINQLFWAAWLTPNTPLASPGEISMRALQAFLFLVPVTLMYFFSTRILFLAEEIDDRRTRISMTLVVLSIVFRWIAGADPGR